MTIDLCTYLIGLDELDRCLDELRRTGLRLPERDRERDFFLSSTFSGLTDLRKVLYVKIFYGQTCA